MNDLKDFENLITQKGLNLDNYSERYQKEDFQELFNLAITDDFIELVEYLYTNFEVKFYLNLYISTLDKDYFQELNRDKLGEGYRIVVKKEYMNNSLEYLKEMKKNSKLKKDQKGFYYLYSKKI